MNNTFPRMRLFSFRKRGRSSSYSSQRSKKVSCNQQDFLANYKSFCSHINWFRACFTEDTKCIETRSENRTKLLRPLLGIAGLDHQLNVRTKGICTISHEKRRWKIPDVPMVTGRDNCSCGI